MRNSRLYLVPCYFTKTLGESTNDRDDYKKFFDWSSFQFGLILFRENDHPRTCIISIKTATVQENFGNYWCFCGFHLLSKTTLYDVVKCLPLGVYRNCFGCNLNYILILTVAAWIEILKYDPVYCNCNCVNCIFVSRDTAWKELISF